MSPPIYDTNFAHTLSVACNDFHEALMKRWREKYVEAIKDDSYDYPTVIERETSPTAQPLWEAHTKEARCHIVYGHCGYIEWVEGGQQGSLSAVQCPGDTGVDKPTEVSGTPADGGGMVTVKPHIRCGIGDNLKLIDQWATGERDTVYYKLPLFDTHDLHALEDAHHACISTGKKLGLQPDKGSGKDVGKFDPVSDRDLPSTVKKVASEDAESQDFWDGWTGLAAERAKAGFFASVGPTLNNQSGIVGALANMYSARAAIIEKARNDSLYWIQWATKSCDQDATVKTDLRGGWKVVQGIGYSIAVYGAVETAGAGAVVGASVSLVGFLGENLLPEVKHEEYKYEVEEIVKHLNAKIDDLNRALGNLEDDYSKAINALQHEINNVNSYNLELYDLTQNNPHGDHKGDSGSYSADVGGILRIGEFCYESGERYNDLLPSITNTADADKHLAGEDGKPTGADTAVLDVRDQLKGFLGTTTGRYVVAGGQVKDAAREYASTDADRKAEFDRIMGDWHRGHIGEIDVHGDPDDLAEKTDRGDYGSGDPGKRAKDGEDYETD